MEDNGTGAGVTEAGEHPDAAVIRQRMQVVIAMLREQCQEEVLRHPKPDDGKLYCNATFDNWGCWNYTPAGTVATIPCPPVFFHNAKAFAVKECEADGTWKVHNESGREVTNYTLCAQSMNEVLEEDPLKDYMPLYIFVAGNCLSIVMLIFSLIIFFAFRQLRCERITVHKNLFVSYVLTGFTWILYYVLVALDGDVLYANPVWCRVLHVVAHYCTVSNFAWMFCEGLYLHVIMAHAFRTGKTLIRVLLFIGWVDPLVLTIIYACVREFCSTSNQQCWLHPDSMQWIVFGPVIVSVVVNIFILINLVRLLVTKLRQVPDAPQSRTALRATLILVPLFGLQLLMVPAKPEEGTILSEIYHYFGALIVSLQGALVSVMYCFCNGEVTSLIRRKWHQHRLMTGHVRKNTALTSSTYTEGYSVVNTSLRDLSSQKSKVAPDLHNKVLESAEMKPLKQDV